MTIRTVMAFHKCAWTPALFPSQSAMRSGALTARPLTPSLRLHAPSPLRLQSGRARHSTQHGFDESMSSCNCWYWGARILVPSSCLPINIWRDGAGRARCLAGGHWQSAFTLERFSAVSLPCDEFRLTNKVGGNLPGLARSSSRRQTWMPIRSWGAPCGHVGSHVQGNRWG